MSDAGTWVRAGRLRLGLSQADVARKVPDAAEDIESLEEVGYVDEAEDRDVGGGEEDPEERDA